MNGVVTSSDPQVINRKIMSISFVWYHFFYQVSGKAYIENELRKSGLNFTALEMLIPVLGDKAVLR